MKKFDDLPIEKFDIMLIDVEGREYDVIKGGYQKISKNKQIKIMEIWDNPKRKSENMITTKEDVVSYLLNLNYNLFKKITDNYIFFPKDLKA